MKTIIFAILLIIFIGLNPMIVSAQSNDNPTPKEEVEGKAIWNKLQVKEKTCQDLKERDFELLGEYFMDLMMGDSHEAMNQIMKQMMGKEGEEQMHGAMGKRMSGCNPEAPLPQNMMNWGMMGNWTPMMTGGLSPMAMMMGSGMMGSNMMGGWSNPLALTNTYSNPLMWNFGGTPRGWGFGWLGWIFMSLWIIIWVLLPIVIIAVLVTYISQWFLKGKIEKK